MPRIAEVALFTDDVPGLVAFYERLLGRPPDSSSDSHASFDLDVFYWRQSAYPGDPDGRAVELQAES